MAIAPPPVPAVAPSAARLTPIPDDRLDVVIVGGGIVGLTLACSLGEAGLTVAVVERQPLSQGLGNGRSYALTLLTGDIFQGMGLWDEIRTQITAFDTIQLSDGHYPGVVQLRAEHLRRSALGYVGEHRVLLHALWQRLQTLDTVTWLCPAQVLAVDYGPASPAPARATVTLTHSDGSLHRLHTPLVVAADGARSPLRCGAGIGTKGWAYWQSCIGFTVRTEKPHNNTAYERFWPSGPFAILPLPGQRCQVVWTAPHDEAQRLAALPEAEFTALLMERFGSPMGAVQLDSPRIVFPVQLMHSDRYSQEGLALVGDAAHCCHPVGGQGMNLGIRDAVALGEVVKTAQGRGEDWGSGAVLKRYERWRRWENWAILAFTDGLDRCFSNGFWPLVWARRLGLHTLQTVAPVRQMALGLMTGQLGRKPSVAIAPPPVLPVPVIPDPGDHASP
ncbi:FAD-dependent hydroxylase [Prochlorothrix hollandica]|uniref:FAD-dependent hydroxylase n=1 Tax=Prochlorothrix hollandica TaxID=1223 RepID=UPI000378051D|nr:FAD-dependent hydroxylase [Prochlorothrix hollandica]